MNLSNTYKIGSLISLKKGKKPNNLSSENVQGLMPYVDIKSFETGVIDKYTDGEKCVECKNGDLLIVCDGSRSGLIGKAIEGFVGSTLALIELDGRIDKNYLYYFIQGKYQLLNKNVKGTGTPHLKQDLLKSFEIAIPSLEIQKQIVQQIEEQLSELDSAVETLNKTKQQLEIYRQAVLKEAFYNDKKTLLRYYKIDDFAEVGTGATPLRSNKEYYGGEIPWITSTKINDKYIYTPTEYITEKAIKETNCRIYPPHTLFVAMYGEGKTRGKCAELMIPAATNQALAAIMLRDDAIVIKDYLFWFLVYNYGSIRLKSAGGVQPNINLNIVKNIMVPIPSIEKQKAIVSTIEAYNSICDMVEQTVNQSLQQTKALRQSILKQAFEGK